MNKKILLIILIFIFILVLVTLIFSHPKKSKYSYDFLDKQFNNTTTDINNIGGLLVNNFGTVWFETMLKHGDVQLSDTAVCASINRHTCTAYSLIRKDMIPMFFMFPGINLNVPCGIILDTKKVWSLITLMAVVDGDTNNRSNCTNESYGSILTRSPFLANSSDMCIYNTLLAKYGPDHPYVTRKYAVYIPKKDKGGNIPTSCNGDLNCMYANSGGNINQWMMNSSPECISGQYKDCFNFTEVDSNNVDPDIKGLFTTQPDGYLIQSISDNCATCSKPYLCVFDEYKSDDKYKTVYEPERIATYIGKDGIGYQSAITSSMDIGDIAIKQCRFERNDWNLWINVVKQHYRNILTLMKSDNSMDSKYNSQLANPKSPSYFENEVNLYIDPDTNSSEYKKQNNIWKDAIVGFYYTGTTCEEQLKNLNGIQTTSGNNTFNNNVDRCDTFFQQDNNQLNTTTRRQWEINNIQYSRQLVHQVTNMFNKNNNANAKVYKCTADSNSFPNYKSMTNALENKIKLNNIFQLDENL